MSQKMKFGAENRRKYFRPQKSAENLSDTFCDPQNRKITARIQKSKTFTMTA